MTCPRCGTKTRSKTVCPACGHRSRRTYWFFAISLAIGLIAFLTFVGDAYFEDMMRPTDSLADKVDLNIGDDTVSADEATTVDFEKMQESLLTVSDGTGFLISPRDVLTAASNVAGLTNIIMYHDGKSVSGTVVGRTSLIAVIRIEESEKSPLLFTQAIASENETLLTLTMKERINGTVTFSENGYSRNFNLPRHAIGSPLVATTGQVVAIHLPGIALPVALFERDVREFLKTDTPAPPPVELAPVAPITPNQTEEPAVAPEPPPAEPEPTPEADTSTEAEPPLEDEPVEPDVTEEETTEPEVTPEEPVEPEEPPAGPKEPTEPPETDEPVEDEPTDSEDPEEPTTLEPQADDTTPEEETTTSEKEEETTNTPSE